MKAKAVCDFLHLLTLFGHDGDTMCLATIEEWLNKGVAYAVKHYQRYLDGAEVKVVKPQEIASLLKQGYVVWSVEGLITPNKGNKLPLLNNKIMLLKDLEKLSKNPVIIVPSIKK